MAKKIKTAIPSIRNKCLDCSGGSYKEVRLCPSTDCDLWPYRFGKRPTQADIDTFLKSCDENK